MTELPVTVYSPASPLREPGRMVREMGRDLLASRELAWRLFVRDRNAQFRQSALGYFWAFIPPLVASLPFVLLNAQGVVAIQGTSIPYPAFAMIGTIIWQVFVDALTAPLKTVTASKTMLARINFPREAILLSGLGMVFFNFLIRLMLLVGVFIWFKLVPPPTAPLFLVGIMALILAGFVIGVLLTPLGLLYADVAQMIPIMTMFLMFLTPVLYPEPKQGLAGAISAWNPLTPLVLATRDWLTLGTTSHVVGFVAVSMVAGALLLVGWVLYRLALPHVIARIGN